jgi:hypothetical protein
LNRLSPTLKELRKSELNLIRLNTVVSMLESNGKTYMPSKIATDTPFSWRKLLGYWVVSIVIAYALGWTHIALWNFGAQPLPSTTPPRPSASPPPPPKP